MGPATGRWQGAVEGLQRLILLTAVLYSLSLPTAHTRPSVGLLNTALPSEAVATTREEELPGSLGLQWAGGSALPPASHPRPLIGILSQPGDGDGGYAPRLTRCPQDPAPGSRCAALQSKASGSDDSRLQRRHNGNESDVSYIAASYVKWVESSGARPVAILYDEPEEDMLKKFRAINGLIIPGGGTDLVPGPFFTAVERLLNWALLANDAGDYFPVQGTCMGLEALTIFVSQNFSILQTKKFASEDNPATLSFRSENAKSSGLFAWMSPALVRHVQIRPLTMENHADGTTVDQFLSSSKLADFFHVLTTSFDKVGTEYVSTVAGKQYPFYGTQWHPEKNAYEWGLDHIPHSAEGVAVCQAAANFFVNEARRNKHAPASEEEMDDLLIYNYDPLFSGRHGEGFFEQSYVFKKYVSPPAAGFQAA